MLRARVADAPIGPALDVDAPHFAQAYAASPVTFGRQA
jgi:hypothetical protein